MTRRTAIVAVVAFMLGACAGMRKVDVGPSSATTYTVDVRNARGGTVTISFTDGTNDRALGTVAAGATERFIIASPSSTTVSLWARTSAGTALGPYTVSLTAGVPTRVTIQ